MYLCLHYVPRDGHVIKVLRHHRRAVDVSARLVVFVSYLVLERHLEALRDLCDMIIIIIIGWMSSEWKRKRGKEEERKSMFV